MLTIYSGRECLDKEKFIFDHTEGKTLLLVPDQFTLGAEQRAFSLLGVRGLMDLEVLSPSRLGMRILERLGGARTPYVDRVGRHMLLSRILREEGGQLDIFRGMEGKPAFALALNDLISEMKQLGTTPELLQELLDSLPEGEEPLLCRKLRDVHRVYRRYEEEMAGRFADTEDRMTLYIRRIREDKELRETQVWVWGFDYFTPKNLEMLRELMKFAREVRLVLTLDEGAEQRSSPEARTSPSGASRDRDLFAVTREMKERVRRIAREEGIAVREELIPQSYRIPVGEGPEEKRPAIAGLERELFAIPMRAVEEQEGVTLVRAATLYGEAESAAAKIISLVRDEGLRFRDMAVICNDLEGRGSVIRRVFEEYGIPVFLDKKRSCTHNPLVELLSATLDLILGGWKTEDVFRMVKTGLAPLEPEEAEELENYAVQYRVQGSQWKKPFFRGRLEYGEERLADRNREREALVSGLVSLEEDFCRATEVGGKLRALYRWMSGEAALPDKLDAMMMALETAGWQELADETRQIWQAVVELMDQMMLLLGEEELPDGELAALMNTGFTAMEIGLIPPTVDRLTVGTMQRTRVPRIKALLVIGANEGVLPQEKGLEGLLSEEEKRRLHGNRIPVCQTDELRSREERLGIYRMLSLPQRHLWVSCAATDQEGKEIKPSPVFEALVRLWGAPPRTGIC